MSKPEKSSSMRGFPRPDGRFGIRNYLVVAYLVECAHHVARKIATPFEDDGVQLIGFPGCYPSDYAHRMLCDLSTHPNVGAVLLVSLGCEEFQRSALKPRQRLTRDVTGLSGNFPAFERRQRSPSN